MIYIVNTGASNSASVKRWLTYNNLESMPLSDKILPNDIALIPGVGSWDNVISNLQNNGQWDILLKHKQSKGKFIGICLGFQLLMLSSNEGNLSGLGVYDFSLKKFPKLKLKVPHVGFNEINFSDSKNKQECYFTHSFYLPEIDIDTIPDLISVGYTNYGINFISFIETKNCLLSQFHPEKSSFAGNFFIQKIKRLVQC